MTVQLAIYYKLSLSFIEYFIQKYKGKSVIFVMQDNASGHM